MSTPDHSHTPPHHHHHAGHAHPPASATLSLLRMSAAGRLTVAGALIAVLWLVVWWAMQ